MDGRVLLLPDGVINQIAAGEVVERPASVLKELLENAVDAGAKRIQAEIYGTFPFGIRVSDEGCGMTAAELRMAVRRHTTSKIRAAEDLLRISTFGFRGEALPSIAAVSRLRIVSRPASEPLGTEVVVEGGQQRSLQEVGAPVGTTVEASDLFWNVLPRRKFLKSPRTEMAHLWEVFHAIAIPSEGIDFRMSDGRGEHAYEKGESRIARALRHAGDDGKYLVPIQLASPFFRIRGWAGLPHLSRFGSSGIAFFVNGRHFRDRGVYAAVKEAYRGILPADRNPVVCLFIECEPSEADVNVHPSKTEVRFRYGRELYELVTHAIGQALGEVPIEAPVAKLPAGAGPAVPAPRPDAAPQPAAAPLLPLFPDDFAPPGGGFFSSLKPIGQVLGTFIVCEGAGELVLVDQHAADERIVFSRLKDACLGKNVAVQRWLVPQAVMLPGSAKRERAEVEAFLSRLGFVYEGFGENTYKITGGPAVLGHFDLQKWWKDFCEFLVARETLPKGIFDADRELWRLACHASVRAGDPIEKDGMRVLLHELDRAVASHSCPHGRPVWVRFSGSELRRMFGRS